MTSPEHAHGHLYEQVLELAKREIDEAASQMEDLKSSIQLLEARVEAAKSIYESVAARLNLEDEDQSGYASAYQEPPKEVPEPPESAPAVAAPPESVPEAPPAVPEPAVPSEPEPAVASPPADDLSLIRQHLAQKLDGNGSTQEIPPPAAPPVPDAPSSEPSGDEKDAFSMELIRRHLAEKSQTEGPASAAPPPPSVPPTPPPVESKTEPDAPTSEPSQGGLSDADRELIGAYLRSKQS